MFLIKSLQVGPLLHHRLLSLIAGNRLTGDFDPYFVGNLHLNRLVVDPGDEPDVETDSLTVKQTSEEQALDSLRKSFNLEKINETGR